ncbi:DUF1523 family protein [Weissella paramesenteroides]|uniref:DUF1523 family protein n=1 Tax=Weissella paramesenteroides TaxID=1249 RepID=UPI001238CA6D|nr:DUF1523 family protein [Weissella paramesenteroides]KAA8455263.1 DUF1523 family protein [Weissella paramesenteroides]KAA8456276.1 DUF1523 family protein [Weissella paramesenteroides]KAA8458233.1 DUF1523 family protein [Weissella paramesenteroides]KAA8460224.1 DUF1523 family protein [Weissella paramesenteroides]KAA8461566.1 DUF1523 family protein [Weissella paramesenteroides]
MKMKNIVKMTLISILVIALMIGGTLLINAYRQPHVRSGEITNLYVKNKSDDSDFFIVLNNDEVIKNDDSFLFDKFNSADIQAKLSVGDKVKIKTAGFRNNLFSQYENLVSVKKVGNK